MAAPPVVAAAAAPLEEGPAELRQGECGDGVPEADLDRGVVERRQGGIELRIEPLKGRQPMAGDNVTSCISVRKFPKASAPIIRSQGTNWSAR
jgi:hypothetical protein